MSDDIQSLSAQDIDIEELERRIELGQMMPASEDSANDCNIFHCISFGDGCRSFTPPQ